MFIHAQIFRIWEIPCASARDSDLYKRQEKWGITTELKIILWDGRVASMAPF